jgi:YegS/Rv2252/BmrU family lipid kinase
MGIGMEVRNVAIVVNPIAGRGTAAIVARDIQSALLQAGIQSVSVEALVGLTPELLATVDAIIPAGGDGTIRAVVRQCLNVASELRPILPVPLGTANLMCCHLGIPTNRDSVVENVLKAVRTGQVCHLDAGRANGDVFLLMAGVGLDAAIVHDVSRRRKGGIRHFSYILPSLIAFFEFRYKNIEVLVDGLRVFGPAPGVVFIGNVREYGTGFSFTPNALATDGLLDVCVILIKSRWGALVQFLRAAAGVHLSSKHVVYLRGKHVRVIAADALPVQVDGDAAGYTPLEVDILPARVPFLIAAQ